MLFLRQIDKVKKKMKRILLVLFVSVFAGVSMTSCLNDDDIEQRNLSFQARVIDSVAMPDSADLGSSVQVTLTSSLLADCQNFYGLDYDRLANERTVTFWSVQDNDVTCGDSEAYTTEFNFAPTAAGTYYFKFWAGQEDETQENIYIEKTITIVEP